MTFLGVMRKETERTRVGDDWKRRGERCRDNGGGGDDLRGEREESEGQGREEER